MVEPVSLTVGAIAATVFAKAIEKGSDDAVDGADKGVRALVTWLRRKFAGGTSPALARVEAVPDSPRLVNDLAVEIDQLAADPTVRTELQALIETVKQSSDSTVVQIAHGNGNVQANNMSNSQVTVTQAPPPSI